MIRYKIAAFCVVALLLVSAFTVFHLSTGRVTSAATTQNRDSSPEGVITIQLQPLVTTGLSSPVFLTNANDGSNRLFIIQQGGIIKVLQPGATTPTDYVNITTRVLSGGERGLLGLAFHPQYTSNRRFFVYYTRAGDAAIQIAEYKVSTANPNVADTAEIPIINVLHPNNSNHNGGTVAFGPDNFLYFGPGDGGSANDPPNNAQNINQLLGKINRIDIDHPNGPNVYSSPSDNPFFGATAGADEIYMVGMRNPYRFSFDRGSGQLWIADVGQGSREEIDIGQLGRNFGWRTYEGNTCTNLNPTECIPANFVFPVAEYSHTGGRCSITGGYVYRGRRGTFPVGNYVYGDYCTGEIFMLQGTSQILLLDSPLAISSFGEDEAGEIYVVNLNGGVYKIVNPNAPILRNIIADFDGDLKTDFSVYRPSSGVWYVLQSFNGAGSALQFGLSSDLPVPGDYDGDGKTDKAVFRPSEGNWYLLLSANGAFRAQTLGTNGDIPVPGDYDGDKKTDMAVFRQDTWFILRSSDNALVTRQFGLPGDRAVPGDYDGDGKTDLAVFRSGVWYYERSINSQLVSTPFGLDSDLVVPADYDGDARTDIAVYRQSNGTWYLLQSRDGYRVQQFGLSTDTPVPGDYDADGEADVAVYRNGTWYALLSSNGSMKSIQFGTSGDVPIPAEYIP